MGQKCKAKTGKEDKFESEDRKMAEKTNCYIIMS